MNPQSNDQLIMVKTRRKKKEGAVGIILRPPKPLRGKTSSTSSKGGQAGKLYR